jgi:hypothetical protein
MQGRSGEAAKTFTGVLSALGEEPIFRPGDRIRILSRAPVGHYRMPFYLRGKRGTVEAVIEPAAVDNEEEVTAETPDQNATITASPFQ